MNGYVLHVISLLSCLNRLVLILLVKNIIDHFHFRKIKKALDMLLHFSFVPILTGRSRFT